jgi:hypothetical protein
LIAFWISKYVWGSAMVSPIPIEWPEKQFNQLHYDDSRVFELAYIIELNNKIQQIQDFSPIYIKIVETLIQVSFHFTLIYAFINLQWSWNLKHKSICTLY